MKPDPLFVAIARRMAWRHALPWFTRGLGAGFIGAGALLLVARIAGWTGKEWWDPGVIVGLTVSGAVVGWLTRPSTASALRAADRLLELRDRLTTAWEYSDRDAPILRLQRGELAARAQGLDLRRRLPVIPRPREATAPALGAVVLLAALLAPVPQGHTAGPRANSAAHFNRAAARIGSIRSTLPNFGRSTLAALPRSDRLRSAQIRAVLARLQRELAASRTSAQALKAIAKAQQDLNRLSISRASAQRAALAALASAVQRAPNLSSLASALRKNDPAAIASEMRKLADEVAHASPAQRDAVARAAQAAASAAAADPALSQQLQNAATALAQNDSTAAKSALNAAARQAAADAARAQQQTALDQANASLDNARNDVSGLSQSATHGAGASAAGRPQGQTGGQATGGRSQGQGNGSKGGSGQGQGSRGANGQGSGNGAGKGTKAGQTGSTAANGGSSQGNRQASGSGSSQSGGASSAGTGGNSGGSGGKGQGGGRGGSGKANGAATGQQVFVPAPAGQGPSSSSQGTPGQASRGSLQPWQSVLPAYERSARASLENGSLPPDERAIVKRYFDNLSH